MFSKKLKIIGFFAVLLITGFVYYLTLASGLYWIDSSMYLSAVSEFGIAYTPGYPIYIIIAKLWSFLPIPGMDFTQKVNFLSAVFASLSCGVMYLTILELFKQKFSLFKKMKEEVPQSVTNIIIAVLVSVVFGLSYSMWFQATYAEVYSLDVFLFGLAVYFVISISSEGLPDKILSARQKKLWIWLVVVYGLSFANHPMTIAFIPAIVWFAWQFKYPFNKDRKFIKILIAIFLLSGFLPYIYMPIRSAQNPDMDWGNVETLGNFISHVSGVIWTSEATEFGSNKNIITTFIDSFTLFYHQFFTFGLILAAIGIYYVGKNNKYLFRFLLLAGGTAIFLGLVFTSGEYESWLIPGYYVIALFLSAGIFYIFSKWKSSRNILIAILLLTMMWSIKYNWYSLDRSHDFFPVEAGHNILKNVEDDAVLFIEGGPIIASVVYNQEVLNYKPNVILIHSANVWLPWARENLKKYEEERGLVLPDIDMEPKKDGRSEREQFFEINTKYLEALLLSNVDKFNIYADRVSIFYTPEFAEENGLDLIPWGFGYKYVRGSSSDSVLFGGNTIEAGPELWDFDFTISRFCKLQYPSLRDFSFFECEYFGMNLENGYGYRHPEDLNTQSNNDFNNYRAAYAVSYMNLGDLYTKRDEHKKAMYYYNRAVNLFNESFDDEQKFNMYFKIVSSLYTSGQYEKTIEYVYKVDEIYPKRAAIAWILAASLEKLGRRNESIELLFEALREYPKDEQLNNLLNKQLMPEDKEGQGGSMPFGQ
ncbi:MAG: DUF2723 domain-containing protein [bacterium]|nr:DUF2723 domain-containing protein [bacterium]